MAHVKKLVMHGFKSFARKTEIPFDKGINVIIGPNGSGKSCSYDSIVTLASGDEIELGKLVDREISNSNNIKELDDGIYVDGGGDVEIISLNKETMKSERAVVSKFIKREGDTLYKIKTQSGRELKATGCHPVMSFVEGKVESRLIKDMKEGSLVATPRFLDIQGTKINTDLARILGYIIGDGYIAKNRIEFVNGDLELIEDFKKAMVNVFYKEVKSRKEKNIERLFIYGKEVVEEIRGYFGNFPGAITSDKKKVPSLVLRSDNSAVANFLAGLYDSDGSVRKDVQVVELCTKNKELARQVQSLLLRFGIISRVKKRKSYAKNTEKKVVRDYFYIYITGYTNLKRFYDNIKLRCNHKLNVLEAHIGKNVVSNVNVDLLPHETNKYVRELSNLLGVKVKNERAKYPLLSAYIENRCQPTREGISRLCLLFEQRLESLLDSYKTLALNQLNLIDAMDSLNLSSKVVSNGIGLHSTIIRNQWATKRFSPRPENLQGFFNFVKTAFEERLPRINELILLLRTISQSDIFWDRIKSIEKVDKPEWVYDLTVEENHNFVANNIFAHNSNISDAICFALGRLSVKSMRAEKAKNLIFMGSKYEKPAREAYVEIVFDNEDRSFNIDKSEISLKRIVRLKGQSVYKINGETKTRAEVIETLAQAGIDPYGYNLILQGQIQSIVRMHGDERRKIIGEVAGISVYEWRKEKSLKELEKTDSRLKEVSTILRERTAYLNNLEKEKSQAQKYNELQLTVKRAKASILKKKYDEKQKEVGAIDKAIDEKSGMKDKKQERVEKVQEEIDNLTEKINEINSHIRKSAGVEQGKLREQITNLRAELEGLKVRREGYENRRREVEHRIEEMKKSVPELEKEIQELRKESPLVAKKSQELKAKKIELAELEKERKRLLSVRSELSSLRERIEDKKRQLSRASAESESLVKRIEEISSALKFNSAKSCEEAISSMGKKILEEKEKIKSMREKELENERVISVSESEIKRNEEIKKKVKEIDLCPLCQSEITEEHIKHVYDDCDEKIGASTRALHHSQNELKKLKEERNFSSRSVEELEKKRFEAEKELITYKTIAEKNEEIKKSVEFEKEFRKEIDSLEAKKKALEQGVENFSKIDEKYENKMHEIEEISSRTEEDIDTTLLYKERELEKVRSIVSRSKEDLESIDEEIGNLASAIKEKGGMLNEKEAKEEEVNRKFKKMFSDRDSIQRNLQDANMKLSESQNEIRQIEDQINYLKIGKAKLDGESQTIEMDLSEYVGVDLLPGTIQNVEERLKKSEQALLSIGSINMRALEVYDQVKGEYDIVKQKADTIEKEKEEIMKIIEEIDKKKRKTFMKTFKAISDLFSRNFSRLSSKGTAYLEMENKDEDVSDANVNIVVRMQKGKYFDVSSLSGGEQTLVALSLLFAIQEYKPYHFYILDEIDAALDKRNSERLAGLLKQYMKSGQYIVVTHNDAVILDSNILYGISMHEGVSKVLSLKVGEG